MKNILTRTATITDAECIQELLKQLGYPNLDPDSFLKTFEKVLTNESMRTLVAITEQNEIVGYTVYSYKPQLRLCGESFEVDELSVSESTRGNGVGTLLLNEVKRHAVAVGAKRILLSTNRDRESYKRGFYKNYGFEEKNSAWLKFEIS
jgi:N-acetylglutamate synthase-like GNAT family acetyltransferase